MNRGYLVWGGLALILGAGPSPGRDGWSLTERDRVLFCGDARRIDAGLIETYVVTRFPRWEIGFFYSDCRALETDVTALAPTIIVSLSGAGEHSVVRIAPRIRVFEIDVPGTRAGAAAALASKMLLGMWNVPATVTAVEIDVLGKTVRRQERTTVRELQADDYVSWTQDDEALPLPDGAVELSELNKQTLIVTGLTAGRYRLTVDGKAVGTFFTGELAAGINLALLPTPMVKQAAEVHGITTRLGKLREAELVNERRAAAQPRTHDFELQPLPNPL